MQNNALEAFLQAGWHESASPTPIAAINARLTAFPAIPFGKPHPHKHISGNG